MHAAAILLNPPTHRSGFRSASPVFVRYGATGTAMEKQYPTSFLCLVRRDEHGRLVFSFDLHDPTAPWFSEPAFALGVATGNGRIETVRDPREVRP